VDAAELELGGLLRLHGARPNLYVAFQLPTDTWVNFKLSAAMASC